MSQPPNGKSNGHSVEGEPEEERSFDYGPGRVKFADKEKERQYVKERLALAYRVLSHLGVVEGASGHLTSRDPIDRNCFWVNPYGLHFSRMKASDLLLINHSGDIIMGGKPDRQRYNTAAFVIHKAIHDARPDVDSAVHCHSPWGKAFASQGRELPIYTQDAAIFYNDHALYNDFGGVVLSDKESAQIVGALGGKKALIMQNHGLLAVGRCIESAVAWFFLLENECRCVMRTEASCAFTGKPPISLRPEVAEFTWRATGTEEGGKHEAEPFFDLVEELCQGAHKL
ncbi:class II aldolase/adducin N-terminal [Naematelia encephala]|uniref:Class II aldolase/adducin N-terminal n=1 Tax=Naematelia encephala TaxID=71784 RepID=A0A1Y2B6M6_9TREE|nr:class II aldolase/adducin N-terminal [Naematelia encephala]